MSELEELRKYHAEIVSIDWHECEAMRLTRWAIAEIERLRGDLAAESNSRVILMGDISVLMEKVGIRDKQIDSLRAQLAMAEDAAAKGDLARQNAGAMEMRIAWLEQICHAAYQLAGVVGAPVRFLDALALHADANIDELLPVTIEECNPDE